MSDNVLLHLGEEPRFDQIKTEDIKPALQTAYRDRYIVARYLSADHGEGFALGGVDLTWHDGRAWFVGGDDDLTDTATRTRG